MEPFFCCFMSKKCAESQKNKIAFFIERKFAYIKKAVLLRQILVAYHKNLT